MRFCYAKLLDTPEEDPQALEFVNPFVDSEDEDDDIFEPERSSSGVSNIFVNQLCVKKIKMYLSLPLGSMLSQNS